MDALTSLREKLRPLGLYALDGNGVVDAELAAYAEGLDLLYEEMEELARECFVQTAESYGLESRERMAGALRPELSLAARREMLLYRGAVTSNDFTRESIERALVAAGFRASVTEYGGNQNLYVNCLELLDASITAEEAMAAAAEFLPAHLGCDYDFSPLTWTWIEQKEWTFAQMDAKDLSWQQIDAGEVA